MREFYFIPLQAKTIVNNVVGWFSLNYKFLVHFTLVVGAALAKLFPDKHAAPKEGSKKLSAAGANAVKRKIVWAGGSVAKAKVGFNCYNHISQ